MKKLIFSVVGAAFAAGIGLAAQVQAPNAAGVSAAHEHLLVTDQAATSAFWTALTGAPIQIGSMNGVHLPSIYVLFQANRGRGARAGEAPAAPPARPESTVGSVVDAIGFKVKSLRDTLARLDALGVKPESGATTTSAAVMSPERVRILLTEDASIAAPTMTDELVLKVPNPDEAAAWYAKWFGATVVKRGSDPVAQIPGMNMRFVSTPRPLAGTRGRALDHIGFEVKNLQALVTKLQEGGVTINRPYGAINLGFLNGIAFVTDPWGTYIELNEGYPSGAN